MNKLRRARLSLAGVLLIVMVNVLSACDDGKPASPTPIQVQVQATVQPTVAAQATSQPTTEPTALSNGTTPVVGSSPASLFEAGKAALNAGKYDEAIEAFTQVIAAVPDYGPAFYARGVAHASKNEMDMALDDLNMASSLVPDDPQPVLLGGIILQKVGRSDEAIDALSYAIQINPNLPDGYYWRATVYIAKGFNSDALDDLQTVVKLSPNTQMGQQAAAVIDQINKGAQVEPIQPVPLPTPEETQSPPALQEPQPTALPQPGQTAADLGFRPEKDGFSFPNWGFDPNRVDLTPNDVRRMFGDQACASIQGENCILTPAGQQWLDGVVKGIHNGHCEGFAVLSLVFYEGKEKPSDFGANSAYDLQIDGNQVLQREIAYYWALQGVSPIRDQRVPKTPAEIVQFLTEAFKNGQRANETYTFAFWKPGYQEGHAITPYGIKDLGDGKYDVLVYDNNHPGKERTMRLDVRANTWEYNAAINPNEPDSQYRGDASTQTLMLTPVGARLNQKVCPFCKAGGGKGTTGLSQAAAEFNTVNLEGNAHLLISDKDGHRLGYVTPEQFVNEIPGADFQPIVSSNLWKSSEEPIYYIPTGIEFSMEIRSVDPKENTISTVSMIGPGYVLSVQDIALQPGESDAIDFSEDGSLVTYRTQYTDSPDILLGVENEGADYAFLVKGVDLGNGGTVKVYLDKGTLAIDTIGNTEPATYGLVMYRIDDKGEQLFGHDGITLQPNDIAHLDYAEWGGDGTTVPLKIDHNGDGTDDETLELTDLR